MDREMWYGKSTVFQMLNAWHEVRRAIRVKNEGRGSNIRCYIKVATDLLRLVVSDPKNKDRIKEIEFYIEIIEDYFLGENKYNTTDEVLLNYFDTYMEMYYDELEREDENNNVEYVDNGPMIDKEIDLRYTTPDDGPFGGFQSGMNMGNGYVSFDDL